MNLLHIFLSTYKVLHLSVNVCCVLFFLLWDNASSIKFHVSPNRTKWMGVRPERSDDAFRLNRHCTSFPGASCDLLEHFNGTLLVCWAYVSAVLEIDILRFQSSVLDKLLLCYCIFDRRKGCFNKVLLWRVLCNIWLRKSGVSSRSSNRFLRFWTDNHLLGFNDSRVVKNSPFGVFSRIAHVSVIERGHDVGWVLIADRCIWHWLSQNPSRISSCEVLIFILRFIYYSLLWTLT